MNLGERLFELRKAKNLTQDDVAEKLNVTRQTVSKWETNQSTPDFDKIVPLCELYEISPNELLTGEKQEQETVDNENSDEFNWNEAKKHLFTRGKDDEDNYENMTKNQIKRKSAEVVSSSILIFFIAIAFAGVGTTVWMWNPVVVGCIFLILIGWGVLVVIDSAVLRIITCILLFMPYAYLLETRVYRTGILKAVSEIINKKPNNE